MEHKIIIVCGNCGQKNNLPSNRAGEAVCGKCKKSLKAMSYNPAAMFCSRKAIYDAVKESQHKEHDFFAYMNEKVMATKGSLLCCLSDWLLAYKQHDYESALILSSCGLSSEQWIELQQVASNLQSRLQEAETEEAVAQRHYNKVAPFGWASETFASDEHKITASEAGRQLELKKYYTGVIRTQISENDASRQNMGEHFLRRCMDDTNLLIRVPVLHYKIQAIFTTLAEQTDARWREHRMAQSRLIETLNPAVENLVGNYK